MPPLVERQVRQLRLAIEAAIPPKVLDRNLVIGTWRWPRVYRLTDEWVATHEDGGARDLRAILLLAEVARHFDVLAVQGLMSDAPTFLRVRELLGADWSFLMTGLSRETTYRERTAILYDSRKVMPHGLAGQIVLPGEGKGRLSEEDLLSMQFFRPPFFAAFRCLDATFTLVNQHLVYGKGPETIREMQALGRWLAEVRSAAYWERNLVVVGQLQLGDPGSAVHRAFDAAGLRLPADLEGLGTFVNSGGSRTGGMWSSIAWPVDASGDAELTIPYLRGGVFNHLEAVPDLARPRVDYLSQHLPVWAEFEVRGIRGAAAP